MVNPKKKIRFRRQMSEAYVRVKESWRRPRGQTNKVRKEYKGKIAKVKIGYKADAELRFLHPSGYKEVLIHNLKELEKVDPKTQAVRIASTVGKKKRLEIIKKAEELGIKVLNPQL